MVAPQTCGFSLFEVFESIKVSETLEEKKRLEKFKQRGVCCCCCDTFQIIILNGTRESVRASVGESKCVRGSE